MGYSLAGWVGLLHSVLHGLACLSGSSAVGMLLGVGWGWLPSAFLRYVGWGGVFSVSWLCCGGRDGRSLQAAPFGWGFLVPCGASVCWFWMYRRPSQSVCPCSLSHNLWPSDVPSVLRFSSGRQLNNTNHYRKLDRDLTSQHAEQVTSLIHTMVENREISKETGKYLTPSNPRTARFYHLPKLHKPSNPGRPIVSSCGAPTERISEFADYHLQPLFIQLPSYLRDTRNV